MLTKQGNIQVKEKTPAKQQHAWKGPPQKRLHVADWFSAMD